MKRFYSSRRKCFSGFSRAIPMVYVLSRARLIFALAVVCRLYVLVAYDTQYDGNREDDLKIGVKSTAILFALRRSYNPPAAFY
jgi:4-hydroxybenzoate polyprenyltransferase